MHTAIIMDGNGRWATERDLTRPEGHQAGADAVRRVVEAAPQLGIDTLTLYAFSSDNWRRPRVEVDALMRLFAVFLDGEIDRCLANGVRVEVIGRRDRLSELLRQKIADVEIRTAHRGQLLLRIAVDYSSRDAIVAAARSGSRSREEFTDALSRAINARTVASDVDLLIRTGRERRLSDFLLWECAYAELYFTDVLWPEFNGDDLALAVDYFTHRERRFGGVGAVTEQEVVLCSTSLS